MNPDENTRLPWDVSKVDPNAQRPVERLQAIAHRRQHPISDCGVQLHSIMGGPAPNWEPNRPAAPYVKDLINTENARQNDWVVGVIVGGCTIGIIVTFIYCLIVWG